MKCAQSASSLKLSACSASRQNQHRESGNIRKFRRSCALLHLSAFGTGARRIVSIINIFAVGIARRRSGFTRDSQSSSRRNNHRMKSSKSPHLANNAGNSSFPPAKWRVKTIAPDIRQNSPIADRSFIISKPGEAFSSRGREVSALSPCDVGIC